jgi:CBS domain-containing protein
MKTVRQILKTKPFPLWSVSAGTKTFDAIKLLAEKGIGALLVMADEQLVGIFSERDYARKVALKGKSSLDTPVRDVMTTDVLVISPEDSNEYCMALMTDKRVRHLPVIENGKVIGIISIGDLVKDIISEQEFTIRQLESYIHG